MKIPKTKTTVVTDTGSFRDPAGFIIVHKKTVYRHITFDGREDYDFLISSGLYSALTDQHLLVPHKEVTSPNLLRQKQNSEVYKVIKPQQIPFISYPYEWCFSQLKDAALLTLQIQKTALKHGMILKDASAYNVQFIGNKPIFIDTLSFKKYTRGDPWEGYKQFCEHFLAPLALAAQSSPSILATLRVMIDGIPLDVATKLLPAKSALRWGILSHVYIHRRSQTKYKHTETKKIKQLKVSPLAMEGLISSLESTVKNIKWRGDKTEWGEYYTFTNYNDTAFKQKKKIIAGYVDRVKPKQLWDMGGNVGEFSEYSASKGIYTVCFDIDPVAVEKNYRMRRDDQTAVNILPLTQDLTNPSTSLGWAHQERKSLEGRGKADMVMALALVHHLAIGNNLPLEKIGEYFSRLGKNLVIEFVPKEDSKVQILLKSRRDIFPNYTKAGFEAAMAKYFKLIDTAKVKESKRTIYLYEAKKA